RYKKDSPSGTAISIGKIIAEKRGIKPEKAFKMGRNGFDEREEDDITFHSVRGGKIVSDHEILFIGDNEIFKISHTAFSREIFLDGVIQGIYFISGKKSSLYNMQDILKTK
ncbi:MAG: 4-hydroxy-tetrahydrodipicolinate reductase, partial [Candidatus Helarchaeota archaeon]|nr:4-hydroxy-tetrahydrodipicolinate reductase [Candidatus Helarchaeota archaeon]